MGSDQIDLNGDSDTGSSLLDKAAHDLNGQHLDENGNLVDADGSFAFVDVDADLNDTIAGLLPSAVPSADDREAADCLHCKQTIPAGQPRYPWAAGWVCLACGEAIRGPESGYVGKGFAAPASVKPTSTNRKQWKWLAALGAAIVLIPGTAAVIVYLGAIDHAAIARAEIDAKLQELKAEKASYEHLVAIASAHATSNDYAFAIDRLHDAQAILNEHPDWVPNISSEQLAKMERDYRQGLNAHLKQLVQNAQPAPAPAGPDADSAVASAANSSAGSQAIQAPAPAVPEPTPAAQPTFTPSALAAATPNAPSGVTNDATAAKTNPTPAPATPQAPPAMASASPRAEPEVTPTMPAPSQSTEPLPPTPPAAPTPPPAPPVAQAPQPRTTPFSADELVDAGSQALADGDLKTAQSYYVAANKLKPGHERARIGQALILYLRGETTAAVDHLEEINAIHTTRLSAQNLAAMYQYHNSLRSTRLMYDYLRKADHLDPDAFDYYILGMWNSQWAHVKTGFYWRMSEFYNVYEQQLRLAHGGSPDQRRWGKEWVSAEQWRANMDKLDEQRAQLQLAASKVDNRQPALRNKFAPTLSEKSLSQLGGNYNRVLVVPSQVAGARLAGRNMSDSIKLNDEVAEARYAMYEAYRGLQAAAPPMPTDIPFMVP